jgi:hypothetical protein
MHDMTASGLMNELGLTVTIDQLNIATTVSLNTESVILKSVLPAGSLSPFFLAMRGLSDITLCFAKSDQLHNLSNHG